MVTPPLPQMPQFSLCNLPVRLLQLPVLNSCVVFCYNVPWPEVHVLMTVMNELMSETVMNE